MTDGLLSKLEMAVRETNLIYEQAAWYKVFNKASAEKGEKDDTFCVQNIDQMGRNHIVEGIYLRKRVLCRK